jgi:hypothetical protein
LSVLSFFLSFVLSFFPSFPLLIYLPSFHSIICLSQFSVQSVLPVLGLSRWTVPGSNPLIPDLRELWHCSVADRWCIVVYLGHCLAVGWMLTLLHASDKVFTALSCAEANRTPKITSFAKSQWTCHFTVNWLATIHSCPSTCIIRSWWLWWQRSG